ncbi:protein SERAC1 isoform 3-T3 [Anomaloglossus baeobatrachus]
MSVAAYCLICCRKISTAGTASRRDRSWKDIRNIARITGSLFLGGCVFITYEIQSLRKAITLDTQALQQEKLQSYIYVHSLSADQNYFQEKCSKLTNRSIEGIFVGYSENCKGYRILDPKTDRVMESQTV